MTTYDLTTEIGRAPGWLAEFGDAYGAGDEIGRGWIAARVPNPLDTDAATLTWSKGGYAFGTETLELLRRSPATYDVTFDVPDTASIGETVTAALTVHNRADVPGTFVGALNRVGPLVAYAPEEMIRLDIPPGGTIEWSFAYTLDNPEIDEREDPSMQFHLHWRDGSRSPEIDIVSD